MYQRYEDYKSAVTRHLWDWADKNHRNRLDGGKRHGRPPVLKKHHAADNILTPPDELAAEKIRNAIDEKRRHRWFRSLKSSQALSQSVFGALDAFDRLKLLQDIKAECGRPAFFNDCAEFTQELEFEVDWLNEPSRTSVDVMFTGPQNRIAVECKFTEPEFSHCSRPRKKVCDGSYTVQKSRVSRSRCALTEAGIRYWDYLPKLFDWPANQDHTPCPFADTYQLARNALAAKVSPKGRVDIENGHVLVLYDDRNPEFHGCGKAEKQWRKAVSACLVPGLFRRLSWQRLASYLAQAPELDYLVYGLRKYGFHMQAGYCPDGFSTS